MWCLEHSPGQSEEISKHCPRFYHGPAPYSRSGSPLVQRGGSTAAALHDAGDSEVPGPLHHGNAPVSESSQEVGTGWPLQRAATALSGMYTCIGPLTVPPSTCIRICQYFH